MRHLGLIGLLWLCACGGGTSATSPGASTGDEVDELRAENARLRSENDALRAELDAQLTAHPIEAPLEAPDLASMEPLRAVCTGIVFIAGLTVRYGDHHPHVIEARAALHDAEARLETARAAGTPDVAGARSALAVMLAEERMGRDELGPRHPDAMTWTARATALTTLISELEASGTCTAP